MVLRVSEFGLQYVCVFGQAAAGDGTRRARGTIRPEIHGELGEQKAKYDNLLG